MLTIGGDIELNRRYFWSKAAGGFFPVDALIGITLSKASPAAREACSTMGVVQDFAQGAEDLRRLTGLRISKERLRQITESEGAQVEALRGGGALPPSWSATQAATTLKGSGTERVYVGADGVTVHAVMQAEKDKRRKDHAIRRQQRGKAGVGNLQPLPRPKAGSDERFKEMKIGIFYDQSKTRKHVFATEGNHERFGKLLRLHADALRLEQATETLSLTDGSPWIRNQLLKHLKKLQAMLLDFYHLSEHVWDTAKACPEPRMGLLGRRRGGPCLGPAAASRHQTHRGTSAAGGHRGGEEEASRPGQTRCSAIVAELHRGTVGDGGVPGGVGQRLGHRLRPDGSHVQEPHPPPQTPGHEMGYG